MHTKKALLFGVLIRCAAVLVAINVAVIPVQPAEKLPADTDDMLE